MPPNNRHITSLESLVTTHEETRAGFLAVALEKNRLGDPFVKNALAFKAIVSGTRAPEDLLAIPQVRPFLATAAGLSDKSLSYLNEEDQDMAISELVDKFLKPAGKNYIDEAVFRYLLIKGDTLGGSMRNKIGALASSASLFAVGSRGQERLVRDIYSSMSVRGMRCYRLLKDSGQWAQASLEEPCAECSVRALHWSNASGERTLIFNARIPTVKNNVDICLFASNMEEYSLKSLVRQDDRALMFGELKGGVDPAGADEHWKTGNTALNRIRMSFAEAGYPDIKTSFVGAAIELAMAKEIFAQLESGTLTNAANLTNNNQLIEYCSWLIEL